jgi:hypothetical protein
VLAYACQLGYLGRINRKIVVQEHLEINMRPYLKNNKIKKG